MKQFGSILNFELKYYFKNKVFVGVTVFLVLLIAAVMFFPQISKAFRSDEETPGESKQPVMLVKAGEDQQADTVRGAFAAAFPDYDVQSTDADTKAIEEQITEEKAACAFVITSPTACSYYVHSLSMYDTNAETARGVLQNHATTTTAADKSISNTIVSTVFSPVIFCKVVYAALKSNSAERLHSSAGNPLGPERLGLNVIFTVTYISSE